MDDPPGVTWNTMPSDHPPLAELDRERIVRSAFEQIGIGINIVDPSLRLLYVNDHTRRCRGRIDLAAAPFCYEALMKPPRSEACGDCPARLVLVDGASHEVLREVEAADGRHRIRVSAHPVLDAGRVVAAIETVEDITGKILVEERLRDVEEQLFRARKAESLATLTGGIAHDFNNILTSIMGNLTLSRLYAEKNGRIQDTLERAERSSQRAKELIRQLLTFARGDAPRRAPFDLAELLVECVDLLSPAARAKVRVDLPGGALRLNADRAQLMQVVNNLLVNADQATGPSGRIGVALAALVLPAVNPYHLPAGDYLQLRVSDDGAGIPSDQLGRIFDPYFTTKPKGSGLGLAIAHSIVRDHDGVVAVESTEGRGSLFNLYLPALPADDARAPGRPHSVLVAGPEQTVADVVADMLTDMGCRATVRVGPGRAVGAILREAREAGTPYEALFLDIDGAADGWFEALRAATGDQPGLRIVACGGTTVAPCAPAGVVSLEKPCRYEDLERAMNRLFAGR